MDYCPMNGLYTKRRKRRCKTWQYLREKLQKLREIREDHLTWRWKHLDFQSVLSATSQSFRTEFALTVTTTTAKMSLHQRRRTETGRWNSKAKRWKRHRQMPFFACRRNCSVLWILVIFASGAVFWDVVFAITNLYGIIKQRLNSVYYKQEDELFGQNKKCNYLF